MFVFHLVLQLHTYMYMYFHTEHAQLSLTPSAVTGLHVGLHGLMDVSVPLRITAI